MFVLKGHAEEIVYLLECRVFCCFMFFLLITRLVDSLIDSYDMFLQYCGFLSIDVL